MKAIIRRILKSMGYEIRRIPTIGQDPFLDMRKQSDSGRRLVVFDVRANLGQTVSRFRTALDEPVIHSFEPSPDTFAELRVRTSRIPDLRLNNCALGSRTGVVDFLENTRSDMSSVLEPGPDCWGTIKATIQVEMSTIDEYCAAQGLGHIDILKSDTQGFDLEVIKGATRMLHQRRIHMIYLEITFSNMYKRLPRLDAIYGFLADHGFCLVSFYPFTYQHGRAGWTDALFINPQYSVRLPRSSMTCVDTGLRHV